MNGLKFICKLASDANEASNRFETRIASIATIAESMAKRMPSCDIAYTLSSFEIITQCTVEGLFAHNKQFYRVMPVWSTAIGGLPVPNYVQLTMRGHPDRLTNTLSLLQYIKSTDHEFVSLVSTLSPLQFNPRPSFELLLMDPHALDLTKHLSVNSVLKESVRSVIQAVATNRDVTKYFSASIELEKQDLVTTLAQIRPYPAQFCAELFRGLEPGLAMQVMALFHNTRTLVQLAQSSNQGNLIQRIRQE